MASRYPQEIRDYIIANHKGITCIEMADRLTAIFGEPYTLDQIYGFYKRNGLHPKRSKYPEEVRNFIFANHKGNGHIAMSAMLRDEFGLSYTSQQMKCFYKHYGLHSGTEHYQKGHTPWNKGKSGCFSPAQKRASELRAAPIGSERINERGFVEVKVARDNKHRDYFVLKHHQLWEQANGPIPKGSVLIFLDGDKTHCTLDNLQLVTKPEATTMVRKKLRFQDRELTKSGALVARVIVTAKQKSGSGRKNRAHTAPEVLT